MEYVTSRKTVHKLHIYNIHVYTIHVHLYIYTYIHVYTLYNVYYMVCYMHISTCTQHMYVFHLPMISFSISVIYKKTLIKGTRTSKQDE